jgi:hypothetical protein
MSQHRFKIGQGVYFHPRKSRLALRAPAGPYQITRRIPAAGGEFKYAITSANEGYERIVKESELTRVEDRARPLRRSSLP